MAKTITLIQVHEIELIGDLKSLSHEELLEKINHLYDYVGQNIVLQGKYERTILHEIDNEEVRMEGDVIGTDGIEIILEGLD